MEDDAPVIYGLEFQARALTPQTAETDAIRFLIGTQSLRYDNQIHIIDFDDENNIINKNVLLHQVGEIWHISTSPADKGVLATCYNKMFQSFGLAVLQSAVNSFSRADLCKVVSPQCVLEHEIAFHFVELHEVPIGPFLQTVAVHLEFHEVINEDVKWFVASGYLIKSNCDPQKNLHFTCHNGVTLLFGTMPSLLPDVDDSGKADALYAWYTPFASDSKVMTCAAVWRMPKELESGSHESPDDSSSNTQTLELLCHLDNTAHGNMACVMWEPMGDGKKIISLADNNILLWDLQESSAEAVLSSSAALEGKGQLKFTSGRWSPHHNCTQIATANDTTVRGWDTRTMRQIYCIENAHGQLVRDLDFNPNKQYYLASCGDDCKVKFWDTRNVMEPVKTLEEHSHWVWNVRYNHSHDQLILTGSSDSRVILSNMVSISSEPFGHMVDDDELSDQEDQHQEEKVKEPLQDSVIATYEEHEDSVYAVEWSSADPWLFASLSYDGRLVINRVPRALKYHILL